MTTPTEQASVRTPSRAMWAGVAVAAAVAGLVAAGLAAMGSDGHGDEPAVDAVRQLYAAGAPADAQGFQPASLPQDLEHQLLADGPLQPSRLEPVSVADEVAVGDDHVHVVRGADGTRWCVSESGDVTYDCMLAWHFASVSSDTDLRAAARLRYYPERTVLVLEMVNDTNRPLDPRGASLGGPFEGPVDARVAISVGPASDSLEPLTRGSTWQPGEHVFMLFTLPTDTRDTLLSGSAELGVAWEWGTVDIGLLEVTWLLGPLREGAEDDDHDH